MKIVTSIMQDPVTDFPVSLTEHMVTWKEETFFDQDQIGLGPFLEVTSLNPP